MKRKTPSAVVGLLLSGLALCGLAAVLRPGDWKARYQDDDLIYTIYAYRQWQSLGIKLEAGDRYTLRAEGGWQYSPIVGMNGPTGGRPAVASYPMPGLLGGTLIGRIGETGEPFYVGARMTGYAQEAGMLYLRINDDLLGDNQGQLNVRVEIMRATRTPAP